MTFRPIIIGIISSFMVWLLSRAQALGWGAVESQWAWLSVFGGLALGLGYLKTSGVARLLLEIHIPSRLKTTTEWIATWISSCALCLWGGWIGPEGPAIASTQFFIAATRSPASRWFEQLRREDLSASLAAGIAASMGTPWAAILLPMELRIGGRVLATVSAALVASIGAVIAGVKWKHAALPFEPSDFIRGIPWAVGGGLLIGALGTFMVWLLRHIREAVDRHLRRKNWARVSIAAFLLAGVCFTYPDAIRTPSQGWTELFESSAAWTMPVQSLHALSAFLIFILLVGLLAPIGFFWPLLTLGGTLGLAAAGAVGVASGFPAIWVGGAALWAAVLGAPLSGAVLAFELSQDAPTLALALIAALVADRVRSTLKVSGLVDLELQRVGINLEEGRSRQILRSLSVRGAAVLDAVIIRQDQTVGELKKDFESARYPFFPVINEKGRYIGLLTADMIRDSLTQSETGEAAASGPLESILEAKDLLYRFQMRVPTVKLGDTLEVTTGIFDRTPAVPVLDEEGGVAGLLFVHHVRIAYDQEVGRRSLTFEGLPE